MGKREGNLSLFIKIRRGNNHFLIPSRHAYAIYQCLEYDSLCLPSTRVLSIVS